MNYNTAVFGGENDTGGTITMVWSDSLIKLKIPSGVETGQVFIFILGSDIYSNRIPIIIGNEKGMLDITGM